MNSFFQVHFYYDIDSSGDIHGLEYGSKSTLEDGRAWSHLKAFV